METKHIVSYGAGIDSTAMIFHLLKNKKPIDYVVFADTGSELPETYKTLERMDEYLKQKKIPLIIVKPNKRGLKERCEDREVIPDRIRRWCTRDVKITPIFAFYRTLNAKINQYIGIDAGEKRRCKPDPKSAPYVHNVYPLVEANIDRKKCVEIILDEGFPPVIKSGCSFCIYNNIDRWYWLWQTHSDLFDEAMKFEESNKHFPKQTLYPKMPLREMKKLFESGKTSKDF